MLLTLTKDLTALKRAAEAKVDQEAEEQRLLHVTPGSAQAMVYLVKENQARATLADPAPDPAHYPLIACTVGIEINPVTGQPAQSLTEVAHIVVAMSDLWASTAAQIETLRLSAKAAIHAAATPAAIEAAATVDWSSL